MQNMTDIIATFEGNNKEIQNVVKAEVLMDYLKDKLKLDLKKESFDYEEIKKVWFYGKSKYTQSNYSNAMDKLFLFLENEIKKDISYVLEFNYVDAKMLIQYLCNIEALADSTKYTYLSGISSFFDILTQMDLITKNPFLKLDSKLRQSMKNNNKKELLVPTKEEITYIIEYFREGYLRAEKEITRNKFKILYTVARVMHRYGLRVGAIQTLKKVNSPSDMVVYKGKSKGKVVIVKFTPKFIESIEELGISFEDCNKERVSKSWARELKKLYDEGKIEHAYNCHSIRHYFAVKFYTKTCDIYALSKALNHSGIAVTERYLRSLNVEITALELED